MNNTNNIDHKDVDFMEEAIKLAKKSLEYGDIPVGAVIVKDGKIIGAGFNKKEKEQDPSSHAEVNAIKEASKSLNNWRLNETTIYVTLEPCPMCASLILQSRISKIIIGCPSFQSGAFGTVLDLSTDPQSGRTIDVEFKISKTYEELLNNFFNERRNKNNSDENTSDEKITMKIQYQQDNKVKND